MNKIRIGVIPAGGKGERISPLSILLPKAMVPVIDRPILEFVIKRMINEFGVEEIYIIVGDLQEVIKSYFGDGKEFGVRINYIDKQDAKRIGDAVYLVKDYIKEPFLVILGDDFTIGSIKDLAKTFFDKGAYAVEAMTKEVDNATIKRTCCAVINNDGKIERIIEKPEEPISHTRGCGIYIFHPKAFEYLERMDEERGRGITELVDEIAKDGKAYAEFIKGANININTKEELLLANLLLARILEKQRKIDMEKIYKFLNKKYNKENNGFFKKIGIIR